MTTAPLPVAIVGLGRIGRVHARHIEEHPRVRLSAIVDPLSHNQWFPEIPRFDSVEALIRRGPSIQAAVVASPTALHREHVQALIEANVRVMVEKPLTANFEGDAQFADWLQAHHPESVMLAFQRRFDGPLLKLQSWLKAGRIGRPFKFVSVLEDSRLMPAGYESPGLLQDMSVHNVDEVLWLAESEPISVRAQGNRLFSQAHSPVVEDYDDASLELSFESGSIAQIFVSRNHVAGYRVESWVFGEAGMIHVGAFRQNPHEVILECYGVEGEGTRECFPTRDYGEGAPEFVERFGDAYASELDHFVQACLAGVAFGVGPREAQRASRVLAAAAEAVQTGTVHQWPGRSERSDL